MTATTTDLQPRSAWATYGDWWKRTPGSALYLLTVFVLAIASMTVLITLLSTGGGLIVLVIGLPLLALALLVARGFGTADRYLLRLTGLAPIPEPTWNRAASGEPTSAVQLALYGSWASGSVAWKISAPPFLGSSWSRKFARAHAIERSSPFGAYVTPIKIFPACSVSAWTRCSTVATL